MRSGRLHGRRKGRDRLCEGGSDDDAVILILSNMEGTKVRKMKAEIARNESDIAGIRRELGRLPASSTP